MKAAPGSLLALAKRARIAQPILWRILKGHRRATHDVAEKVATAMESWANELKEAARDCAKNAKEIREAARPKRKGGKT